MNGYVKKSLFAVASAITILASGSVSAQTSMNGPYYATPSWDQTLPAAQRFIVLSNFNNEAVLDRETGLVWQRNPSANRGEVVYLQALLDCMTGQYAGRYGWRLPSVEELATLADTTGTLPAGHPFTLPNASFFWTATSGAELSSAGNQMIVEFASGGAQIAPFSRTSTAPEWCVRGYRGALNPQ